MWKTQLYDYKERKRKDTIFAHPSFRHSIQFTLNRLLITVAFMLASTSWRWNWQWAEYSASTVPESSISSLRSAVVWSSHQVKWYSFFKYSLASFSFSKAVAKKDATLEWDLAQEKLPSTADPLN